jgi:hypothetical protein
MPVLGRPDQDGTAVVVFFIWVGTAGDEIGDDGVVAVNGGLDQGRAAFVIRQLGFDTPFKQ